MVVAFFLAREMFPSDKEEIAFITAGALLTLIACIAGHRLVARHSVVGSDGEVVLRVLTLCALTVISLHWAQERDDTVERAGLLLTGATIVAYLVIVPPCCRPRVPQRRPETHAKRPDSPTDGKPTQAHTDKSRETEKPGIRLGFVRPLVVATMALLALWWAIPAVTIYGAAFEALITLRGIDSTNVESLTRAFGDDERLLQLDALMHREGFTLLMARYGVLSSFALICAFTAARRHESFELWMTLLAFSVPVTAFGATVAVDRFDQDPTFWTFQIGLSVIGAVLLLALALLYSVRVRERRTSRGVLRSTGHWLLYGCAPVLAIAAFGTVLLLGLTRPTATGLDHWRRASRGPESTHERIAATNDVVTPIIDITYPSDWELGEPGLAHAVWVALPPWPDGGNVVIRAVPVAQPLHAHADTRETFQRDFVAAAGIYANFKLTRFEKRYLTTGQPALQAEYSAQSMLGNGLQGHILTTYAYGHLLMLHAETYEYTADQDRELREVFGSFAVR